MRLITTQWEIVGLGVLSYPLHADGDGVDVGEGSQVSESNVVVLVTFVRKTFFSLQALSVFIQQEQAHDTQKENIVKTVVAALRTLGAESLRVEIDKLKAIPITQFCQ